MREQHVKLATDTGFHVAHEARHEQSHVAKAGTAACQLLYHPTISSIAALCASLFKQMSNISSRLLLLLLLLLASQLILQAEWRVKHPTLL